MDPIDFGPFETIMGTPEQDRDTFPADKGYYGVAGNDVLTCGSEPTFGDEFPNGGLQPSPF